jgi:hypothetical protein
VSIEDRDPGDETDVVVDTEDLLRAAMGAARLRGGVVRGLEFSGLMPGETPAVTIRIELGETLAELNPHARRSAIAKSLAKRNEA